MTPFLMKAVNSTSFSPLTPTPLNPPLKKKARGAPNDKATSAALLPVRRVTGTEQLLWMLAAIPAPGGLPYC